MNELLADFEDVLTQEYQQRTRHQLMSYMAKNPRSKHYYASAISISDNSLKKFLQGNLVSYVVIAKIDNFLEGK